MTTSLENDDELDQHLRRVLAAVAATVQVEPDREAARTTARPRPRRRRRLLVAAGVSVAAIPMAAAAVVRFGPEHVDEIPPTDPIFSGSVEGERYWVVDGRDTLQCEDSPSGVELIVEQHNVIGQEWNTTGVVFGDPTKGGCAAPPSQSPPEDTYWADGGVMIGNAMLWMGALHPEVDEVRADFGGGPFDVEKFDHEGADYFVLEVPPGTKTFTVDYLVDGRVLPPPAGERAAHVLPNE